MDFSFTEEQKAFRKEVGEWLDKELTPEVQEQIEGWTFLRRPYEGVKPLVREFNLKLGKKGWLAINWPKEYWGQGRSVIDQYIVKDEILYRYAKIWNHISVEYIGPVLIRHASEEIKREFLPRIAAGEFEIALGYSEPEAGSDLAALQMRAVEDGDDYVLNGQKMFTTGVHYAKYHWLAARTDPTASRHKGISLFLVDLNSPGITVRPLRTMAGGRTNEAFYDDVRVPKRRLVGEKNHGWQYIVEALAHERSLSQVLGDHRRLLEDLVKFTVATYRRAQPLASDRLVRHKLAGLAADLEVAELFLLKCLSKIDKGVDPGPHETAMEKLFIAEFRQRLANTAMQILGLYGQLQQGSKWAPLKGRIEAAYRADMLDTFGGGSVELMRNMIATAGYGLPRV